MKHLGYRKRGSAPMMYRLEKDGLFRYLHLQDQSGKPVAVVKIELSTLNEIVEDFL